MSTFSTCKNGHNYEADQFASCPFCPATAPETDYKKTLSDFKNTGDMSEAKNFENTINKDITEELIKTNVTGSMTGDLAFKQTIIFKDEKTEENKLSQHAEERKLAGWLVIFKDNQYGQDYKLFTGKNKIGTAPGCDILINDSSVSGEHATIFLSEKVLLIQDNFSTNGTKVNGNSIRESKLKEGDRITLGNTNFKFKTFF